ncbi:MAG: helix-turn-helix transcriptional regulator [Coriobacteriales bacterium]|jgi:DNA-binding CsgD family transcriptional regulator|nr:helix-turn-helix transcriptional regulator [Coriobacteriales bacterium]
MAKNGEKIEVLPTPRHTGLRFNLGVGLRLELSPVHFGLAAPFALLLVLTQNSSPLIKQLPFSGATLFMRCVLIGMILCAIALIVFDRLMHSRMPLQKQALPTGIRVSTGRVQRNHSEQTLPVGLRVIAAICVLTGCLLLGARPFLVFSDASLGVGDTGGLLIGAGLLCGCGLMLLFQLWGLAYAALMPEAALLNTACSLGIASLLYAFLLIPLPDVGVLLYALFLLVLTLAPSLLLQPNKAPTIQETDPSPTELKPQLSSVLETLWKPLIGALISAFIAGLVWDFVAANAMQSTSLVGELLHNLAAPLATSALILAILYRQAKTFTLHTFFEAVIPVAIALLLVIPVILSQNDVLTMLLGFVSAMCFAVVVVAVFSSMAAGVRTTGVSGWLIFPAASIALVGANLTGTVAVVYIGEQGRVLCLVLLTLFLLLMVLDFVLRSESQKRNRQLEREVVEKYLQKRCRELAERYGLSAREQEVFLYLSRGYSHVYIAKELYVSENTIRTHVKHIYSKMSISSREALLQLIDSIEG